MNKLLLSALATLMLLSCAAAGTTHAAPPPLIITTSTLANGAIGSPYSQILTASGGKKPYTWSITTGSLPAGLTLNGSTGVISGTPTTAGSNGFTAQVKDANNTTVTKSLSITVNGSGLNITTSILSDGYVGAVYSQTLAATGGYTPYSWSITTGTLPAGLSLNAGTGVISGIPATEGISTFTVQVTDNNSVTSTKLLTITVSTTYLAITTASLPDGNTNSAYSQTLSASGGTTPYSWSVTTGTLPAGLTLGSTGVISGTPTTAGSNTFTVQVTDIIGANVTKGLTITIHASLSITTSSLPNGHVGSSYNQPLSATGGTPPYLWSKTSGSLPAGITLSSAGVLGGTPTAAGSKSFTVQATDSDGAKATKSLTLVTVIDPLTITTTSVADVSILVPYSQALSATGGKPPYSWSLYSGSLPQGFTLDKDTGVISGTPTETDSYYFSVQLQDSSRTTITSPLYIFTVYPPPVANAGPDRTVQAGTTVRFDASGSYVFERGGRYVPDNCFWDFGDGTVGNGTIVTHVYANPGSNVVTLNVADLNGGTSFDNAVITVVTDPVSLGGVTGYAVTASTNQPLPAASVTVIEGYGTIDARSYSTTADNNGIFTFSDIKAGPIAVNMTKLGFVAPATYTDNLATGDGKVIISTLNVSSFITLTGNVTDRATGQPVPGAMFSISFYDCDWLSCGYVGQDYDYTGFADNTGHYLFENIRTNWSIDYYCTDQNNPDHMAIESGMFSGGPGQVIVKDLQLDTWGKAAGFVTDSFTNMPVPWVSLRFSDRSGMTVATATVDSTGHYLTTNIYAYDGATYGPFDVTATAAGYAQKILFATALPGTTITLNIPMTKLTNALYGIVTDSITGSPVFNALVSITDNTGITHNAYTDQEGRYTVSPSPGMFHGTVMAANYVLKNISGTMIANQNLVLNVQLTPATGYISGKITHAISGAPISGAYVVATDIYNHFMSSWSDVDGNYRIDQLWAGSFSGTVTKDGYSSKPISGTIAAGYGVTANVSLDPIPRGTDNVAVIEVIGNFDAKLPDGSINDVPRQDIAKQYFATHGDVDFLIMLSTFDYAMPEAGAKGFYLEVKNNTQGINRALFNNGSLFGSAGKLQGIIEGGNVISLATAPNGANLDKILEVLNHEFMHRFGTYVRYQKPDSTLSTALLGHDGAHWSYLLDTKGSLMYGNGWRNNGDATFTSTAGTSVYSPLDLYLMGMIPKEQVPPMLLIDNAAIDSTQLPQPGATVTGTAKTVTIYDIIAAEGERIPNASASQKQFTVGFVLLVRSGDNTAQALPAIETLRKAFAGRFSELTQTKGSIEGVAPEIDGVIESPADNAIVIGSDVTVTGTIINTTGAETGVLVNGIPATVSGCRFFVNNIPLDNGANTITVIATDNIALTATATVNVTATEGDYLRINASMVSGLAPLDVAFHLNGSFSIANSAITISGPVAVPAVAGGDPSEFTVEFPVEGTYSVTASTVGLNGQTYSDTVTIIVLSKFQMDNKLRAKWDGMKTAMTIMDVPKATSFFLPESQERYSGIFTALGDSLPQVAQNMQDIQMIYLEGNVAQYRIRKFGPFGLITFYIYFIRDGNDGIWRIQQF